MKRIILSILFFLPFLTQAQSLEHETQLSLEYGTIIDWRPYRISDSAAFVLTEFLIFFLVYILLVSLIIYYINQRKEDKECKKSFSKIFIFVLLGGIASFVGVMVISYILVSIFGIKGTSKLESFIAQWGTATLLVSLFAVVFTAGYYFIFKKSKCRLKLYKVFLSVFIFTFVGGIAWMFAGNFIDKKIDNFCGSSYYSRDSKPSDFAKRFCEGGF